MASGHHRLSAEVGLGGRRWLVFAVSLSDVGSDRIRLTVFACKSYNPRFAFTGISGYEEVENEDAIGNTSCSGEISTMSAAQAQSTAAHAADGASKIGIVSMQDVIAGTAEGKQAAALLQSQFAPRQTELQNIQKQIEDDQTRLRNGQTTLNDDEKARIQREGEVLNRTLQRKNQEDQDDSSPRHSRM